VDTITGMELGAMGTGGTRFGFHRIIPVMVPGFLATGDSSRCVWLLLMIRDGQAYG
jgi:hypothetical protein